VIATIVISLARPTSLQIVQAIVFALVAFLALDVVVRLGSRVTSAGKRIVIALLLALLLAPVVMHAAGAEKDAVVQSDCDPFWASWGFCWPF
jgi:hypothetical protein